jgi:hypothetical protein
MNSEIVFFNMCKEAYLDEGVMCLEYLLEALPYNIRYEMSMGNVDKSIKPGTNLLSKVSDKKAFKAIPELEAAVRRLGKAIRKCDRKEETKVGPIWIKLTIGDDHDEETIVYKPICY